MERGAFSKEQEKALAVCVDDAIEAKGILELVDGYAAKATISLIDDKVIERINKVEIKVELGKMADAVIAKDVEKVQNIGSGIINMLVDIPGLEEDTEAVLLEGVVKTLVAAAVKKLKKDA